MSVEKMEAIQLAAAEHYRNAAQYAEYRAWFEAKAAQLSVEKAEAELKTALAIHHRVKLASRPSMALSVAVQAEERQGGTVYVVSYSGVEADGESPEIACQNFDRLWTGVDSE